MKEQEKKGDDNDGSRGPLARARTFARRTLSISAQIFKIRDLEQDKEATLGEEPWPEEWETAYDMRLWPDFPDRPSRA